VTITFVPGSVTSPATVTYQPGAAPSRSLPAGSTGALFFKLEATDVNNQSVTRFDRFYTLTLSYTDAELAALGMSDANLNLAIFSGGTWVYALPCAGCGVDPYHNKVTLALDHFAEFALASKPPEAIPTPMPRQISLPLIHR
jgi:hypothetical protein